MKNLAKEIRKCTRCGLHQTCTQKVIGRGVQNPKVLWIGEASGKLEDETGKPFCGPSGKLLDKWMEYLGIKEESSVVNCIKCRPPNNRDPTKEELKECRFWLDRQLDILDPEIIIVVGRFAMKEILGFDKGITGFAGRCFTKEGRKVFVMPHPSYYLRNGGKGYEKPLETIKRFFDKDIIGVTSEPFEEIREEKVIEYSGRDITELESEPKQETDERFIPLHVHSMFSIGNSTGIDGAGKIDNLVDYAKELGYKSLALTDHGTMSGLYKFQKLCEERDIKPILGFEAYITDKYETKSRIREHLVLLAKNDEGLKNLFKLNTIAHERFYYFPIVTLEDVIKHKDGIIVTTACVSGILAQKILDGETNKAYEVAEKMKNAFGEDFYVELQYHDFDLQLKVNPILMKLAEDLNIETVISPDTHYIRKSDRLAHNAIKAIGYRKKLSDNPGFSSDEFYLPSPDEAYNLSKKVNIPVDIINKSFNNTVKIANQCNAKIKKERNAIPRFRRE